MGRGWQLEETYICNILSFLNNRTMDIPKSINTCLSNFKNDMKSNGQNILSGFEYYDKVTHGFIKGTLTVIASRPSMGKSAFADTIALKLALKEKKSVLYYSIEANQYALMNRFVSNVSGVNLNSLLTGDLTKEEDIEVDKAIKSLSESSLHIEFKPEIEISQLTHSIRLLASATKIDGNDIDIIFIDYLQLITARDFNTPNREQEIGFVVRKLKSLAKELNIPIVVLSQLNRGGIDRKIWQRPILADLRDSGVIEDVADVICFIHRPEYYGLTQDEEGLSTIGLAEVIISKNRHGAVDTIKFRFNKNNCSFSDYDDEGEYLESGINTFIDNTSDLGGFSGDSKNPPF